ncbi:MAG: hypothetical protein AB7O74_09160 [Candidatus Nanopelagicales bacterium]
MPRTSVTTRRVALAASPLLLLVLTACGGEAVQGTVATPTSSSSSAPATPSSTAEPEPSSSTAEPAEEPSSPEETATPADLALPDLPGYKYDDAPGDFDSIGETLTDTGMVSGVKAAGVTKDGDLAAVVIAAQYNDGLVDAFAGMPAKSVLESVAAGAKPSLTGKVTQKFTTVDGTDVLLLSTASISVAIVYFDDGLLAQMYGPDKDELLTVATAFVKARNAQ